MDFTAHWGWPQWAMAALIFLQFIYQSALHGKPMVETAGENKGEPRKYSGFSALSRATLWLFILIAGGFFR
ncbi:MAG: hypothetical protein GY844_26405 [Bradyrhizobium sp.]|jgi:hypothetical protein|uniref:hypothetical protein n=1 Tax=Sphingomonas sp. VL_57B TaxID=3144220 RepID=UPI0031F5844D|nr:hypothetical protein [Bradyrhizobium sp.]